LGKQERAGNTAMTGPAYASISQATSARSCRQAARGVLGEKLCHNRLVERASKTAWVEQLPVSR
jgi:hypothetical protein